MGYERPKWAPGIVGSCGCPFDLWREGEQQGGGHSVAEGPHCAVEGPSGRHSCAEKDGVPSRAEASAWGGS